MAKRGSRMSDAPTSTPPESAAGSASTETGPATDPGLGAVDPAAAPLVDGGEIGQSPADPGATLSDPADEQPPAAQSPAEVPAVDPTADLRAEALAEALAAARAELDAATEARRVLGDPDAELERLSAQLRQARQNLNATVSAAQKRVDHLMQAVRFETERRQQSRLAVERAEARIGAARAALERLTGCG